MDDWTKEDVREWLLKVKIPDKYADILYNEDVSGASLICFKKQDFLDAGLKHGPAVQILKNIEEFKTENVKHSGSTVHEKPAPFSVQEDGSSSVKRWGFCSDDVLKHTDSAENSLTDTPCFQSHEDPRSEEHDLGDVGSGEQSPALTFEHGTKQTSRSETEEQPSKPIGKSDSFVIHFCMPRPFDKISLTFEYTQNEILPPETGPSNRIDPVHEYKLLANTENASNEDVFKKYISDTCCFAAGCMNTRTNGTIHFGVGDEPQYQHGQIIGIELQSPNRYIDEFYKGLNEHFKIKANIAIECIRPPKFVMVKCPDNRVRHVIEIDIVPTYKLTRKKLFYITVDKKKQKEKCLFIRRGASTINYLPEKNPKIFKQNRNSLEDHLELWVSSRQSAEERILLLDQSQREHTDLNVSIESESQIV